MLEQFLFFVLFLNSEFSSSDDDNKTELRQFWIELSRVARRKGHLMVIRRKSYIERKRRESYVSQSEPIMSTNRLSIRCFRVRDSNTFIPYPSGLFFKSRLHTHTNTLNIVSVCVRRIIRSFLETVDGTHRL